MHAGFGGGCIVPTGRSRAAAASLGAAPAMRSALRVAGSGAPHSGSATASSEPASVTINADGQLVIRPPAARSPARARARPPCGFRTASCRAEKTARSSRKRTSAFVGWTLTSSSSGGSRRSNHRDRVAPAAQERVVRGLDRVGQPPALHPAAVDEQRDAGARGPRQLRRSPPARPRSPSSPARRVPPAAVMPRSPQARARPRRAGRRCRSSPACGARPRLVRTAPADWRFSLPCVMERAVRICRQRRARIAIFWERVGALVRAGHIDRKLLWNGSGSAVIDWWAALAPQINESRPTGGGTTAWENFEWLAGVIEDLDRRAGALVPRDEADLAAQNPRRHRSLRGSASH